jgi:hypothetical protein
MFLFIAGIPPITRAENFPEKLLIILGCSIFIPALEHPPLTNLTAVWQAGFTRLPTDQLKYKCENRKVCVLIIYCCILKKY